MDCRFASRDGEGFLWDLDCDAEGGAEEFLDSVSQSYGENGD